VSIELAMINGDYFVFTLFEKCRREKSGGREEEPLRLRLASLSPAKIFLSFSF
jgi:hypothetical protein